MAWVSKRLSCAHALRLHAEDWRGLAFAMKQGLNKMSSLQQLEVTGDHQDGTEKEGMAHMMSLYWLLAKAPKLRVFSANFEKVTWVPPLSQLKHLVLAFKEDTGDVFAHLPNAEALETLSLTLSGNALEAPALDLENMPCLHTLTLTRVRPAGITLPHNCSLHLFDINDAVLSDAQWDAALVKVRTFDYTDHSRLVLGQFPAIFARFLNITTVALDVSHLGDSENYLSLEGLSQAERLYLCGERVYLTVPARVSWQKFFVEGEEQVAITFADVAYFAQAVPVAYFVFCSLSGPSLMHLTAAWAAGGRTWDGYACGGSTVIRSPQDSRRGGAVVTFGTCLCGACMVCLRRSGIAHTF